MHARDNVRDFVAVHFCMLTNPFLGLTSYYPFLPQMTTLALYLTHVTLLLYLDATQLTKRLATENLVMFEFKGKKEHYNNWDN